MRLLRFRFTIRCLLFVIGISAVFLAAAREVAEWIKEPVAHYY
jgi:hypothetical protein